MRLDEILLRLNEQINEQDPEQQYDGLTHDIPKLDPFIAALIPPLKAREKGPGPVDPDLVRALIYQYPFQRKSETETVKIKAMLRLLLEANRFTSEMLMGGGTRTPFARLIMHDLAFVEMLHQKKIIQPECFTDLNYTSGLSAVYLLALKKAWVLLLYLHQGNLIPFAAYFRMPAEDFRKKSDTTHAFDFIYKNAPKDFFCKFLLNFKSDPEAIAQVVQCCEKNPLQFNQELSINFLSYLDFVARNSTFCNMARALNILLKYEPHNFDLRAGWVLYTVEKSTDSQKVKRDFIRHFLFTEIQSKKDLTQLQKLKRWFSPINKRYMSLCTPLKPFFVTHSIISGPDTSAFEKLMKDVSEAFQKQEDSLKNTPAADEQMSPSLR